MAAKCRLAFVVQDTGCIYGAERATIDLAHGLSVHTPTEVTFIIIRETRLGHVSSPLREELGALGYPCLTVTAAAAFSPALIRQLNAALHECRADCVHVIGYKAVFHTAIAGLIHRSRPWVSTVHGWLERRNIKEQCYKRLEVLALRRATRVVVLSNFYYQLLAQRGFSPDRLRLIPSGIDVNNWAPIKPRNGSLNSNRRTCIGILGRLSEEKNHRMFLRVAERLVQERLPVHFVIAGDGPLRDKLDQQIRASGLTEFVTMAGMMDRHDFFQLCDILVSCSRIENLPYSIMEAMQCSLPVVATAVGGVPDLVIADQTGILVPSDDDAAMAAAVRRLMADRELAEQLSTAARQHIADGYSLEHCAKLHYELYRDVVEAAPQHRRTPN